MKKALALLLALLMIVPLAACNKTAEPEQTTEAPTLETTAPVETAPETEAETECAHSYTEEITEKPKALKEGSKVITCSACGDSRTETIPATKTLKVLAIGNSFSSDATEYLWDIAKDGGVETIIIGNLYIGGCALDKHYTNIKSNAGAYTYYKNTNGRWTSTANVSVQKGLADEEWDIVTVQQASGSSGVENTYTPLSRILDFLAENEPNADVYWHLTWAYQQNSTHSSFPTYGSNQMTMYNAIISAYDSKVKVQESIVGTIPSGTAVQNLRSSYIGDTITRDGYHMSYDYGRYTVALTWFAYLTGGDVDKVDWLPKNYATVLQDHLPAMREAVKGALAKPFEVTKVTAAKPASSTPTIDAGMTDAEIFAALGKKIEDYTLLNWPRKVQSYYDSTKGSHLIDSTNSSASNIPNFISSVMLTKENLPVGSIVICDSGYKYRAEYWKDANTKNTSSTRTPNVTTHVDEVTEAWWDGITLRAFNLSASATRAVTEADIPHLRIYLPKSANPVAPEKEPGMPDINNVVSEETTVPELPTPVVIDDTAAFTSLGLNMADYVELDWLLEVQAYYNSKNQIGIYNAQTSTASNVPNFIASKLLTKEDLPVGSVIIVDSGYQYRPEGWITETTKNSSRPGNVTTAAIQITEAWWGNYTIRAFNLSAVTTRAMTNDDVVHLRIYVPKK